MKIIHQIINKIWKIAKKKLNSKLDQGLCQILYNDHKQQVFTKIIILKKKVMIILIKKRIHFNCHNHQKTKHLKLMQIIDEK